MKCSFSFLIGVLVGAFSIFGYLRGISPDPASVIPSVFIAPVAISVPSNIMAYSVAHSATPAPATTVPAVGRLLIPVAGISASQLNDSFSEDRGTNRSHEAIDIMAPKGTQVLGVADGKIAKLFYSKPGGLTIYQFDTSEKFAYYYAHLDRYATGIKEGLVIKRGDLIGYVGSTGNADPAAPHLHFAIFELGSEKQWWKGRSINPYPLLGGSVFSMTQ